MKKKQRKLIDFEKNLDKKNLIDKSIIKNLKGGGKVEPPPFISDY